MKKRKNSTSIRDIAIFSMLGALMLCSKLAMEFLPNIHLLGMLTIAYTIVFRSRALIPIYIYVMLNGLYSGFSLWWVPYLYVWTVLWGAVMLLPKKMPRKLGLVIYPTLCALHGLFFGALYAPMQALLYGFNFEQTMAWIAAGIPFDIIHCIGNFAVGLLVVPLSELLSRLYHGKYK